MKASRNTRTVQANDEAIRQNRLAQWLRAEDLADMAGCSKGSISNAERGERMFPFMLRRIADELGLDMSAVVVADLPPVAVADTSGPRVELRVVLSGDLFYIPPEPHDSWVVGDKPYVPLHFLGADRYAKWPRRN